MVKAQKLQAPSLATGNKWGKSAAMMLLGKTVMDQKPAEERLREALANKCNSVISLFKEWDTDSDGKVSRKEFVAAVPLLDLGEPFTEEAVHKLFSLLDRDSSGTIDYSELVNELRRLSREQADGPLRKRAAGLLLRTDVVVVLGVSTRAKKAFCSRLAYTFDGTWLTCADLVERELKAFGSKTAANIRRRQEATPPQPISTGILKHCLHAAVHGRRDRGPLPPLRGPFFLYDFPRSELELQALEATFGVAPLALDFLQADYDGRTAAPDGAADDPNAAWSDAADAARADLAEIYRDRGTYLDLDCELETRTLIERVVRHLSVESHRRMIARHAEAKAKEAAKQQVLQMQRTYLEAASQYMRTSIRAHRKQGVKVAGELSETARQQYLQRHEYMRAVSAHRARKQHFASALGADGQPLGAEPPLPNMDERVDEPGAVQTSIVSSKRGVLFSLSDGASTVPPSAIHTIPAPMALTMSAPRYGPRTDLQLSPRNWREPTPNASPLVSLPIVKRVYENSLPWPQQISRVSTVPSAPSTKPMAPLPVPPPMSARGPSPRSRYGASKQAQHDDLREMEARRLLRASGAREMPQRSPRRLPRTQVPRPHPPIAVAAPAAAREELLTLRPLPPVSSTHAPMTIDTNAARVPDKSTALEEMPQEMPGDASSLEEIPANASEPAADEPTADEPLANEAAAQDAAAEGATGEVAEADEAAAADEAVDAAAEEPVAEEPVAADEEPAAEAAVEEPAAADEAAEAADPDEPAAAEETAAEEAVPEES